MFEIEADLQFWLATTFQNTIEYSLQLSRNPAPEQTPYVYKYEAIEKLLSLLNKQHPFHFIVHTILGEIYSDVEQISDSVRCYESAFLGLSQLGEHHSPAFYNYALVVLNMLGLSYINRDKDQEGLGLFAKANDLYEQLLKAQFPDCFNNRSNAVPGKIFRCYYQGGINYDQVETSHTLTLFYLAQAYTKLGLKSKAAQCCGQTLQRQFATNKFEYNDFCLNLIGLSDFYQSQHFYSQAQYLLTLGLQVLPEGRKKKMRAKLQIALGELMGAILEDSCNRIKSKNPVSLEDNEAVNKQFLIFESFQQEFLQILLPGNLEDCKHFFRKASTQLKKALQVFVLDGFVTEHIDILFVYSKLYHNLCKIDLSRERVAAMLEKRREMLEPLLKELNPKAYPATWQKILVEVSEIYSDLFQLRVLMAIDMNPNKIKEDKLASANQLGETLNQYYKQIVNVLESDADAEKNEQYYRSIINSKFNIAKMQSKMYSKDPKKRVQHLKKSWKQYQQVADYISKVAVPQGAYSQQLQLTQQMIDMLPNKIDRINYGQISPLE